MTIPDNEPASGFRVHSHFTLALSQYFRRKQSESPALAEAIKTLEISGVLLSDESRGNLTVSLPAFLQIVAQINDPAFLEILTSYSSFACLKAETPEESEKTTMVVDSNLLSDLDMDFM